MRYSISIDEKMFDVEISEVEGRWRCRLNGRDANVDFVQVNARRASILLNGKSYEIRREDSGTVSVDNRHYNVSGRDSMFVARMQAQGTAASRAAASVILDARKSRARACAGRRCY